MRFIEELKWRNLFKDVTDEKGLVERMKTPMSAYCGFDPTADSLHIGHLQQILLLKRYQKEGHHPIALIGGGTGMIGDPRPSSERTLQSIETVQKNAVAIQKQIESIVSDVDDNGVTVLNNYEWLKDIHLLEFLRDYGKFFNVNTMIAKDTIASRLDTGISFTEFTYTILQALDWLHLLDHHQCEVQIGGSDQWGNLLSGSELIRKVHGGTKQVFGITSPLITKADGSKFGKSEGENIWLDPNRTDAYTFYQFWINVADEDIENFMKRLSMKSVDEIKSIIATHEKEPHKRIAQRALASELTELVFKAEGLESAIRISETLFSGQLEKLSAKEIKLALKDAPSVTVEKSMSLVDLLVDNNLIKSKREDRTLITQGSISINGEKIDDTYFEMKKDDAIEQQISIIKKGKKTFYIVLFVD
ncbi:MAG: tyrosine--tRNA ligase [Erysipelothrix sp.]|nr:tyrosine--tRNA ligase [Erysipelothrix sp.]